MRTKAPHGNRRSLSTTRNPYRAPIRRCKTRLPLRLARAERERLRDAQLRLPYHYSQGVWVQHSSHAAQMPQLSLQQTSVLASHTVLPHGIASPRAQAATQSPNSRPVSPMPPQNSAHSFPCADNVTALPITRLTPAIRTITKRFM